MELTIKQGYKQTEVGLIPEDWECRAINDVCFLKHGFQFLDQHFRKTGIGVVKIGNLEDGKGIKERNLTFVSIELANRLSKFYLTKGDVLMALTGGTLGKVSMVDTDKPLLQNYRVGNFLPNAELNKSFLHQILTSFYLKNAVKKLVNEAAQPNFGKQDFDKLYVPIPPTLTEQKAIATALSDVDALITSLEALITKKKAIKQGAMQELLKVTEDWTTKTIKEVATYRRGSFPQPYGLAKWYDDISGMPFVQVVDVAKNKKLKPETKQKISAAGAQMSVFVKKGSVILTIQGSIGRICITQYDAYVDRTLLIFESFKEDFNTYFFMISIWLKFQIEKEKAPGGIIKTITKEALSSFEISFPNRDEQDRIAEVLEDTEKEIEQLESKKEKYQAIKQGMMQELLTGKTRLV